MTNSIAGMRIIAGSRFDAGIIHAGDNGEPAQQEPPAIRDPLLEALSDLRCETPERRQERAVLLGERHELNVRTKAFIEATSLETHHTLVREHEVAKGHVRDQLAVIDNLKAKSAECSREIDRNQNIVARAGSALSEATAKLRGLGRFAPQPEIDKAQKRIDSADEKLDESRRQLGEAQQAFNSLQLLELAAALKKLEQLKLEERRTEARVAGRDADMAEYGFTNIRA